MPQKDEKKRGKLTDDDVVAKYAPKIEEFLSGEWSQHGVLILEAMNSFERRVVHAFAEGLGLDHKSGREVAGGHKEVIIRRADWSVAPQEAILDADLERVASEMSNNQQEPFVVFEGSAYAGTTTPDSRGLLCGLEPRGSGDWDMTITATPKQAAAGGNQQDCTEYVPEYVQCQDLESLLLDLLHCDYAFVCPNGGCPENLENPCACWQGQAVRPQKVCWIDEWDGNCGDVSFETDEYCFTIEYSTS